MQATINYRTPRRTTLKASAAAIVGRGTSRLQTAEANPLPHLTDANPAAASLEYTEDASTVDARKYPQHKSDQRCANCRYFEISAIAGGPYAPCKLYPGNTVNANGWCAGYVAR